MKKKEDLFMKHSFIASICIMKDHIRKMFRQALVFVFFVELNRSSSRKSSFDFLGNTNYLRNLLPMLNVLG